MRRLLLLGLSLPLLAIDCPCDASKPETLKLRQCSLSAETLRQPADSGPFFTLKDINPRKPNRWLALPKEFSSGDHDIHSMPRAQQIAYLEYAIAEAQRLFGGAWGIGYNGDRVRTQCQAHIHLGRFAPAAESKGGKTVRRVREFEVPTEGGFWIHPLPDGRLHVHLGGQTNETVLVR